MEQIVTRFVSALREAGLRVSPGECQDAVQALSLGGLVERRTVRSLLRLTLVKNAKEIGPYEQVFDRFFSSSKGVEEGPDPTEMLSALIHIVEGQERKVNQLQEREKDDPLLVADGPIDPEDLEELLALEESDDQDGPTIKIELEGRQQRLSAPLPSEFRFDSQSQTMAFNYSGAAKKHPSFTAQELVEIQDVVSRMLVRIRKDVKRMKEAERRGKLHVVRTIQKNYRHGMVPFLLSLKYKRKEKPRLVVLCDVSFSVSHATRFMLLLLHTLQNRVMDVRSFVFNSELAEITEQLRNMPVNSLLETIEQGEVVNLDDNSDYGKVFVDFKKNHLEGMRGKPAIIILGDGRNNYNEANDWALEEIREKAGYMLWLTPEDQFLWKRGDCLIELYSSCCDQVEVVCNVDELSLVVENLFYTLYDHHDSRIWKNRKRPEEEPESDAYGTYYTRSGGENTPSFDGGGRSHW